MGERNLANEHSPRETTAFWLLAIMLVYAPLARGGNVPLGWGILEALAIILLVVVLWSPKLKMPKALTFLLLALLSATAVYLIPLPFSFGDALPGRDLYRTALSLSQEGSSPVFPALSLAPALSERSVWTLILAVSVFLGTRCLGVTRVQRLVLLLVAIAACEGTLGLLQFGAGAQSPLYLGLTHTHFDSGVGTYTNRNHLAGLLEMALPIALGLLALSVGKGTRHGRSRGVGWRRRITVFTGSKGPAIIGYGALVVLFLIALVFTRSRTGVGLTMLGILISVFVFSPRLGGENPHRAFTAPLVIAVGLAVVIGLAPVMDRFTAGMDTEGRWLLFPGTMNGIASFFPVGSGPGTYQEVFPPFQALEQGAYLINHAHNDYLEWLFELGLLGGLLVLAVLTIYVLRWRQVWEPGKWPTFTFIQVGAGIGVLLLGIHGVVDYNLRIPGNIIYFAFLCSVYYHGQKSDVRRRRALGSSTDRGDEPRSPPTSPLRGGDRVTGTRAFPPPPDQIPNPFGE